MLGESKRGLGVLLFSRLAKTQPTDELIDDYDTPAFHSRFAGTTNRAAVLTETLNSRKS